MMLAVYLSQMYNLIASPCMSFPNSNLLSGFSSSVVFFGGIVGGAVGGAVLALETDGLVDEQVAGHRVASGADGEANDNS